MHSNYTYCIPMFKTKESFIYSIDEVPEKTFKIFRLPQDLKDIGVPRYFPDWVSIVTGNAYRITSIEGFKCDEGKYTLTNVGLI